MRELAGKTAVITGAASGIGRALAIELGDRGCRVAVADIDARGLRDACKAIMEKAGACTEHVVDVSDCAAMEEFAADVVREHGAAHLVINNAGTTVVDNAETMPYADFERVMNVNFWGVVHGTRAFLPYLRRVDEAHIVNVSSVFGIMAMPQQAAYNASKFAVRGYTEALKMELADSPIGVSCVMPGGIKTNIVRNSKIAEGVLDVSDEDFHRAFEKLAPTTPEKAARKIVRGIEKNKRRILIGPDAAVVDWIVRHFPSSYEKILRLENEERRLARLRGETLF